MQWDIYIYICSGKSWGGGADYGIGIPPHLSLKKIYQWRLFCAILRLPVVHAHSSIGSGKAPRFVIPLSNLVCPSLLCIKWSSFNLLPTFVCEKSWFSQGYQLGFEISQSRRLQDLTILDSDSAIINKNSASPRNLLIREWLTKQKHQL